MTLPRLPHIQQCNAMGFVYVLYDRLYDRNDRNVQRGPRIFRVPGCYLLEFFPDKQS
jgi:hypothetical protein